MQLPVASITTSSVARRLLPKPSNAVRSHIDTSCPSKPTFLPENHLAEGSVGIYPDYTSHARLLFVQKDGSGGLHDNYGFALAAQPGESQRRPTTNTSSQLNVRDRPARTFVLPAPLSRMVTPYAAIPKTTARHRRRDSHTGYERDRAIARGVQAPDQDFRPCCPAPKPPPCCSGRCLPQDRSPCARSTDGRPSPRNQTIRSLTSPHDRIASCRPKTRQSIPTKIATGPAGETYGCVLSPCGEENEGAPLD